MGRGEGGEDSGGDASLVSVIGGGAIGGLLAALLARAGRPVELVVRAEHLAALAGGIRVTTPEERFTQPVVLRRSPSPGAALLVLAVKLPDLEAACRQIADLGVGENARSPDHASPDHSWSGLQDKPPAGAGDKRAVPPIIEGHDGGRDVGNTSSRRCPSVLLLQNGLEATALAARHLPARRLIGAVVELGAVARRPGEIDYAIPGRLMLGVPEGGEPARARQAAALLAPALPTALTSDLAAAQRLKLLVNLNNGAAAATNRSIQELYGRRAGVVLSLRLMREALAVLAAANLPPERSPRSLAFRAYLALPDALAVPMLRLVSRRVLGAIPVYPSTLQSLWRGRPSEIRSLNGAIVDLGERHRLPTPANRAVVDTVTAIEAGAGGYRTPDALLQAAGGATAPRPRAAGSA